MKSKKPRQKYKQVKSLFGRIEEIPEDWNLTILGKCCTFFVPMRDKPKKFDGDIPWLRIEDFDGKYASDSKSNQRVSSSIVKKMSLKIYPIGTVLCSCSATIGVCAITKKELVTNQTFIGIFPDSKINNEFLYYYLLTQKNNLIKIGSGSTILYISRKKFEQFPIILPSIDEQQKIVSILSNIDNFIEKYESIIKTTKRLKKGIMQKVFTKGIGHKKFKKVKWLFGKKIEIPNEWELKSLEKLVESYRNGIYKSDKFYGKGIPNIRMFNIQQGKINKNNVVLLDVTEEEAKYYDLIPSDILINRVNSDYLVGKSGIVPKNFGPATFESKNIRVRVNKTLCDPEFLNYYFNSYLYFLQILSFIKTAVAQVTINQDDLNRLFVPVPLLEEQHKIASILNQIDSNIADLESKKTNLQIIKKGLMQKLLTGQIRV